MPFLFSYGTLQREEVQLANFGRLLNGSPDELVGFELDHCTIDDPEFLATGAGARQAIVTFTGDAGAKVSGTVFEVTEADLERADGYEPPPYVRTSTTLGSGRQAWVYAAAVDE